MKTARVVAMGFGAGNNINSYNLEKCNNSELISFLSTCFWCCCSILGCMKPNEKTFQVKEATPPLQN